LFSALKLRELEALRDDLSEEIRKFKRSELCQPPAIAGSDDSDGSDLTRPGGIERGSET
jgi:hypothetical protein